MSMTDDEILAEGCRVFNLERQALEKVENDLGAPFVAAVRLILQTKGNVISQGLASLGTSDANLPPRSLPRARLRFSCTRTRPPTAISA